MNKILTSIAALSLMLTATVAFAGDYDKKTATAASTAKPQDIVATAIAAGSFNTLVTAVQSAGLVETLQGPGPFTVFAPNDAAFAKVPKETLDGLLADKQKLAAVLTYHVVAGKVMAADAIQLDGKEAATVNGQSFKVAVKDGNVMVDNAKVIATDIQCSNGVIHVIDTVILPK